MSNHGNINFNNNTCPNITTPDTAPTTFNIALQATNSPQTPFDTATRANMDTSTDNTPPMSLDASTTLSTSLNSLILRTPSPTGNDADPFADLDLSPAQAEFVRKQHAAASAAAAIWEATVRARQNGQGRVVGVDEHFGVPEEYHFEPLSWTEGEDWEFEDGDDWAEEQNRIETAYTGESLAEALGPVLAGQRELERGTNADELPDYAPNDPMPPQNRMAAFRTWLDLRSAQVAPACTNVLGRFTQRAISTTNAGTAAATAMFGGARQRVELLFEAPVDDIDDRVHTRSPTPPKITLRATEPAFTPGVYVPLDALHHVGPEVRVELVPEEEEEQELDFFPGIVRGHSLDPCSHCPSAPYDCPADPEDPFQRPTPRQQYIDSPCLSSCLACRLAHRLDVRRDEIENYHSGEAHKWEEYVEGEYTEGPAALCCEREWVASCLTCAAMWRLSEVFIELAMYRAGKGPQKYEYAEEVEVVV